MKKVKMFKRLSALSMFSCIALFTVCLIAANIWLVVASAPIIFLGPVLYLHFDAKADELISEIERPAREEAINEAWEKCAKNVVASFFSGMEKIERVKMFVPDVILDSSNHSVSETIEVLEAAGFIVNKQKQQSESAVFLLDKNNRVAMSFEPQHWEKILQAGEHMNWPVWQFEDLGI